MAGSIRKPQHERQSNPEPSHVLAAETPDLLSDPFASHGDRLVGHRLRSQSQSILAGWLDGHAKIRGVRQFGSQLADHDGGMSFRESVALHDDRRAGLAIVA